jgi:hypothetical protein
MTKAPVSPLRQRMIEGMTIRKFSPRTQEGYIRTNIRSMPFDSTVPNRLGRRAST